MRIIVLFALVIALLAGVSRIETKRLEARFPPIGDFEVIEGVRLHYTDSGRPRDGAIEGLDDPRPIVLIHGASTSLLDFHAGLVAHLSRRHRVITVDRPGHGYSERPQGDWPSPAAQAQLIHGLLVRLGVERPILVGHSWAGSVVMAYLVQHPEAAGGGVLLAGGTHPWEGGVIWYNALAGLPILGPIFAYTLPMTIGRLTVDQGIASVFAPNPVPDDYRDQTGVDLTLRSRTFLANAEDIRLLSPFLADQRRSYPSVSHPILILTGDIDTIVPAWNHAERLVREAPNAELVYLKGIGHALHHVAPEQVTELIARLDRQIAATVRQPSQQSGSQPATLADPATPASSAPIHVAGSAKGGAL
jgi:pimeloyl-ACP methyl ester carboxylesterase